MPLADVFSSLAQVSKAGQNRLAGCGKEDGKPLPVNKKIKTPPVLPRKLDKFPTALIEKEANDLFSTSIHLVTLLKQKVIVLTTITPT